MTVLLSGQLQVAPAEKRAIPSIPFMKNRSVFGGRMVFANHLHGCWALGAFTDFWAWLHAPTVLPRPRAVPRLWSLFV